MKHLKQRTWPSPVMLESSRADNPSNKSGFPSIRHQWFLVDHLWAIDRSAQNSTQVKHKIKPDFYASSFFILLLDYLPRKVRLPRLQEWTTQTTCHRGTVTNLTKQWNKLRAGSYRSMIQHREWKNGLVPKGAPYQA